MSGRCLRASSRIDKTTLSIDDVQMATDVYDDCIAYLDRRLGLLLDELSRQGVLENTLVVVTSDHGEHLGDHGLFFHGGSLYRQLVQVPLLIMGKKGIPVGRTVAEPVSLRDLPATYDRPARSWARITDLAADRLHGTGNPEVREFVWWTIRCSWRQRSPN